MVTARRDEDLFWAMEEGLRSPGIAAVAGRDARGRSHRRPPPVARRREERRARPAAARPAGAAAKRLRDALAGRFGAVAEVRLEIPGAARWQVELRRNRFGKPSVEEMPSWLLEWNDETHCLSVVSEALAPIGWRDRPAPERLVS